MALSLDDPLLWGVVFVVVFVVEVLIVVNMKTKAGTKYERASEDAQLAEGEELTDILSRFVEGTDGKRIGETVGMDGAKVIVKQAEKLAYLAVPRASLERSGDHFRVKVGVDMAAAQKDGEAWRERQHKVVTYTKEELPEDERDRPY